MIQRLRAEIENVKKQVTISFSQFKSRFRAKCRKLHVGQEDKISGQRTLRSSGICNLLPKSYPGFSCSILVDMRNPS